MNTSWRERLACSAGFFNGEGHIGVHVGGHSQNAKWKRHDLYLSISQTDRFVLDQFQESVGCGTVTGPYIRSARNPNEQDVYYFHAYRFEHVQAIVVLLWPWLSPIKRTQALGALTMIREKRPTHQTTCKNGHPRDAANLTWTPNGKWRLCRACQREKAARQEEKRKLQRPRRLLKLVAGLEDWT